MTIRNSIVFFSILLSTVAIFRYHIFFEQKLVSSTNLYTDESSSSLYFNSYGNELDILFPEGLPDNAKVTLFEVNLDSEKLLEEKNIHSRAKNIHFYYEKHINKLRLSITTVEGIPFLSSVPFEVIEYDTFFSLHITKVKIIILSCIVLFSALATYVISRGNDIRADSTSIRESNVELCRIVSMFLLICHHMSLHGGMLTLDTGTQAFDIGMVFLPIGKICFIAFVAISMWFLVDSKPNLTRFSKIYMETLFYSVFFSTTAFILGRYMTLGDYISSYFVIIGDSHGYAASFLIFTLLFPFIHKATVNVSKIQAGFLLIVLLWIQVLSQIMAVFSGYEQPIFSEVTLFLCCYILSLNLKRFPISFIYENKYTNIIAVCMIYSIIYVAYRRTLSGNVNSITSFIVNITKDESSCLYIIGGYALFYAFKELRIKRIPVINKIASYTFGILLIHDNNFLRYQFWHEIIRVQTWYHSKYFIIYFVLNAAGIFLVCATIDYIRKEFFERSKLYHVIISTVADYNKKIAGDASV